MTPTVPHSMNPADTDAIYAPLHVLAHPADITVLRDVAYGLDERHLVDLAYRNAPASAERPVLVFVHGGGFTSGERRRAGTPFFDNVMMWAAAEGMIGVNATYRLAPDHPWPAGGVDVLAATRWAMANAAKWGGDPGKIVVFGHSAGAAHAAEALARAQAEGTDAMLPAGAVLLSGVYAPVDAAVTPGRRAYYGDDWSLYRERGPVGRLSGVRLPLKVVHSEHEPEEFAVQAAALCQAIGEGGGESRVECLRDHNHFSPVLSLGSSDGAFGDRLREMVREIVGGVTAS